MERKRKGGMYSMNKAKSGNVDVDAIVAAEAEANENHVVTKPKGVVNRAKNAIKVRKGNKAAKKKYGN